jgi:hypothetical protein
MTHDEFLDRQYALSVQAGMNQRYHQGLARVWRRWDMGAKIATAVFATIAFGLAIACAMIHDHSLHAVEITVALVAALAAIALNVIPLGAWELEHRELFRQWTDLREDVEALGLECLGEPEDAHLCELRTLDAKAHRICGQEPAPNEKRLRRCYDAEIKSRMPASEQPAGV